MNNIKEEEKQFGDRPILPNERGWHVSEGMTTKTFLVSSILNGLLSNPNNNHQVDDLVNVAINKADEVISELIKRKNVGKKKS